MGLEFFQKFLDKPMQRERDFGGLKYVRTPEFIQSLAEGSHLVINLKSITIIIQQKGSKMYTCMAGTSSLTWINC